MVLETSWSGFKKTIKVFQKVTPQKVFRRTFKTFSEFKRSKFNHKLLKHALFFPRIGKFFKYPSHRSRYTFHRFKWQITHNWRHVINNYNWWWIMFSHVHRATFYSSSTTIRMLVVACSSLENIELPTFYSCWNISGVLPKGMKGSKKIN